MPRRLVGVIARGGEAGHAQRRNHTGAGGLATVVAAFARRLSIPAPSLLVLARLVAGLVPGVPRVRVTPDWTDTGAQAYLRLRRDLLAAQRDELTRMHADNEIGEATHRRLQRQLDLEEAGLSDG